MNARQAFVNILNATDRDSLTIIGPIDPSVDMESYPGLAANMSTAWNYQGYTDDQLQNFDRSSLDGRVTALIQIFNSLPNNTDPVQTYRPDGRPGIIIQKGEELPIDYESSNIPTLMYLMGYPVDRAKMSNLRPDQQEALPLYDLCDPTQYALMLNAMTSGVHYDLNREQWAQILGHCTELPKYDISDAFDHIEADEFALTYHSLQELQDYMDARAEAMGITQKIRLWVGPDQNSTAISYRFVIFTPTGILTLPKSPDLRQFYDELTLIVSAYSDYDVGLFSYYPDYPDPPLQSWAATKFDYNDGEGLDIHSKPDPEDIPGYISHYGDNAIVLKRAAFKLNPGQVPRALQLTKTILNLLGYGGEQVLAIIEDADLKEQATPSLYATTARQIREEVREGRFISPGQMNLAEEDREQIRFSPT